MEFLLYSISCLHICIFSFNLKYQKLIGSSVKSFLNLPPEGFQWSVIMLSYMYIRFWIPKQVGSLQPLWTFLRRIPTSTKTSEDNNLLRLLATNDENILLAFSSAVKDCQFPMHVITFTFRSTKVVKIRLDTSALVSLSLQMLWRWTKSTQDSKSGRKSRVAYTKIMS